MQLRPIHEELRGLARLPEPTVRSIAVGERLARLGPAAFTAAFDRLARGAARGVLADTLAMLACVRFFRMGHPDLETLRACARESELAFASAILEPAADHRGLGWHGRPRDVGGPTRLVRERVVISPPTDGDERRTRAGYAALEDIVLAWWGPTPPEVIEARIARYFGVEKHELMTQAEEEARAARLAEMPSTKTRVPLGRCVIAEQRKRAIRRATTPELLRRLMRDRDLTSKEVLAIAARRPSTGAVVRELCASGAWLERIEIRSALVENPFTPVAISLMLVPTCRMRLREILRAAVHPRVHELARMCLTS